MLVTSIGSLPFVEVEQAIDAVMACCPEIPFWPQLPRRSFYEDMCVQYLERTPALVVDPARATVYVDTRKTDGIERFYEEVYNDNVDAFDISEQAAPGFYALLERLPQAADRISYVKGQLTGPFTLGIGLKDENGKPVIYDSAYFDIIKKALRMKAAWMIKTIKRVCPDKEVLLFFDEPALVSFGSAFVSVSSAVVTSLFDEVREGLDALVGIHCCGNTDWSVLLRTGVDIISYDAFNFMETLFYFHRELSAFLARGGRIAPGIVPSSGEALHEVSLADLARLWRSYEVHLSKVGSAPEQATIVTTACGLGTLSEADAYRSLELLKRLPDVVESGGTGVMRPGG
jgi:methionine synthase II (cobalamin-independent)